MCFLMVRLRFFRFVFWFERRKKRKKKELRREINTPVIKNYLLISLTKNKQHI